MDVEAYIAMVVHAVRTERENRYVCHLSVYPDAHDVCAVEEAAPFISGIGTRLDYHVCKTLADLRYALTEKPLSAYTEVYGRTREIFDIIIDFPDSRPALDDLKVPTLTSFCPSLAERYPRNVYCVWITALCS